MDKIKMKNKFKKTFIEESLKLDDNNLLCFIACLIRTLNKLICYDYEYEHDQNYIYFYCKYALHILEKKIKINKENVNEVSLKQYLYEFFSHLKKFGVNIC